MEKFEEDFEQIQKEIRDKVSSMHSIDITRSNYEMQLIQIHLNYKQLRLIEDQKKYANTIKWATWVIAVSTMAYTFFTVLGYLKK